MEKTLEKLMRLLTDEYAVKILTTCYSAEKSAIELSQELNVPIAACYRRLHQLKEVDLVEEIERVTLKGKKIKYYNSNIKSITIKIERNSVSIELIKKDGKTKKYHGNVVAKGYGK